MPPILSVVAGAFTGNAGLQGLDPGGSATTDIRLHFLRRDSLRIGFATAHLPPLHEAAGRSPIAPGPSLRA